MLIIYVFIYRGSRNGGNIFAFISSGISSVGSITNINKCHGIVVVVVEVVEVEVIDFAKLWCFKVDCDDDYCPGRMSL